MASSSSAQAFADARMQHQPLGRRRAEQLTPKLDGSGHTSTSTSSLNLNRKGAFLLTTHRVIFIATAAREAAEGGPQGAGVWGEEYPPFDVVQVPIAMVEETSVKRRWQEHLAAIELRCRDCKVYLFGIAASDSIEQDLRHMQAAQRLEGELAWLRREDGFASPTDTSRADAPLSNAADPMSAAAEGWRIMGRIPVLTWRHPVSGAALVRSSQPMCGVSGLIGGGSCPEDEQSLIAIRETGKQKDFSQVPPRPTRPEELVARLQAHLAQQQQQQLLRMAATDGPSADGSGSGCSASGMAPGGVMWASTELEGPLPPVRGHPRLHIVDARPQLNAKSHSLLGRGHELNAKSHSLLLRGHEVISRLGGSERTTLSFMEIDNIHVMRALSAHRVRARVAENACCITIMSTFAERCFRIVRARRESQAHLVRAARAADDDSWFNSLHVSGWLTHVRNILRGAVAVARMLEAGDPVLVHCSDGWDRTNPYFRTIDGFRVLVSKDWGSFGHQFAARSGFGICEPGDASPIFSQFLDAVWQLLQQFPTEFEFAEELLHVLLAAWHARWFSDFNFNSERERRRELRQEATLLLSAEHGGGASPAHFNAAAGNPDDTPDGDAHCGLGQNGGGSEFMGVHGGADACSDCSRRGSGASGTDDDDCEAASSMRTASVWEHVRCERHLFANPLYALASAPFRGPAASLPLSSQSAAGDAAAVESSAVNGSMDQPSTSPASNIAAGAGATKTGLAQSLGGRLEPMCDLRALRVWTRAYCASDLGAGHRFDAAGGARAAALECIAASQRSRIAHLERQLQQAPQPPQQPQQQQQPSPQQRAAVAAG
ncbi:protein-tyrosine phosphatase-like protein [Tribonema minus]|uniref:Protein-tyrosine phosphatase-like protein n=1 Tax=Tribonema minus TaxID=303371 RepID=A0A835ZKR0_9STRA|nr:protein-tyrosine phosphatase-like protein [Tribonema minus]